jgi:two-component system, chemotaxis family, protein-glutamate methylesterase/glutaminase
MVIPSRRRLQPGQRVRALVVDDSAVLRHLVVRTLEQDPSIEVVASAPNGAVALEQISKLNPDVVSLDLEMPEMDGLETLRRIRRDFPQIRVVMFSSHTERGAAATFEALSLGADDYVTKAGSDNSMASLRDSLLPKIKQFFLFPDDISGARPGSPAKESIPSFTASAGKSASLSVYPRVVLIGVSTGGPEALALVLPQIPADFDLPILIVQHMPPLFTRFLCDRLREISKLPVREAAHGERLDGPKILMAPGDFHMRLAPSVPGRMPEVVLDQGPPENSCRPAVDTLFCSAAQTFGAATLSIVMTGMGQDGLRGAGALKSRGGFVIAQDEATSVVWGMPRAVSQAGIADLVLPLPHIFPEMLARLAALSRKDRKEKWNLRAVKP